MQPKLSVIVPVYNAQPYLKECVESILRQSMALFELILVDDGSKDGSGALCDAFAESDARVRVLHQANAGSSAARNLALSAACGEFIAFVDADDTVEPSMYETMLRAAEKTDADAVLCGYVLHAGKARRVVSVLPGEQPFFTREDIETRFLPYFFGYRSDEMKSFRSCCPFADYQSYIWLCVYRASVIREHALAFPSERVYFNEDNLFNLLFLSHARGIAAVPEAFYHYRLNAASLSQTFNSRYFDMKIKKYAFLRRYIDKHALGKAFHSRLDLKICAELPNAVNYYVSTRHGDEVRSILHEPALRKSLERVELKSLPFSVLKIYLYFAKKQNARMLVLLS
ncbi:MAG: glycosyltransferase, partial [Clostridia bacterium]|nr:glycosyltransferase [Clostridia bacterium]